MVSKLTSSALVVLATVASAQYQGITGELLRHVEDTTAAYIDFWDENPPNGEAGQWKIGVLVRLGFHVCIGGCDGCINLNNEGNHGLQDTVNELEVIYQSQYVTIMSRSDYWAMVTTYAAWMGADNQGKFEENPPMAEFEHWYGRKDCLNSADGLSNVGPFYNVTHVLPDGRWHWQQIRSFFSDEFGLSSKQTVALMGAHTLGRARIANSLYRGMWVQHGQGNHKDTLNNKFYSDLIDADDQLRWAELGVAGNRRYEWQYSHPDRIALNEKGLMIPADIALYKDISDLDEETGRVDVAYNDLDMSNAAQFVTVFADSNSVWINWFCNVWGIMVTHGYEGQNCLVMFNESSTDTQYQATC